MPFSIGPYRIDNRLALAPMAGVTDRPFRQLCRRLGAGMTVSEMIGSQPQLRDSRKTRLRMDHEGEPGPIIVQIAGGIPEHMAEAAVFNVEHGAQIIDINLDEAMLDSVADPGEQYFDEVFFAFDPGDFLPVDFCFEAPDASDVSTEFAESTDPDEVDVD